MSSMMKDYLFVYGMFRDAARPLLGDFISCGRASVQGDIWKVNDSYPGFKPNSKNQVWGEVFLVDSSIFDKLDDFEGEEFTRTKIVTSTDLKCWIYEYKFDTQDLKRIKSGDWLLR